MLIIEKNSALDLPIPGSIGQFQVGGSSSNSVKVQYLQTHVKFAVGGETEERFLQNLKPVREVFEISELEFDELMQRDIDDGRVSTELVPYLLEDHAKVLVKLFPPIIVVVLPTNEHGRPAEQYPAVRAFEEPDKNNPGVDWHITRSGELGSEAFEFRQLLQDGDPQEHNYAQLKINTAKCRLAIVDGQHRAMALLALYRNIKDWPENTKKYEEYYARWSPSELKNYDLSKIRLPVMLITFPELDGSSVESPKVTEACRSVFLALNKSAKPVTTARNYLLDDSDIIAHLLRSTLRVVKKLDNNSPEQIRMWNVELDSEGDRRKLDSLVAVTGIMHLYGIIEILMLNQYQPSAERLSHKAQKLYKKKDLIDLHRRLRTKDILGEDQTASTRRNFYESGAAKIMESEFLNTYGASIISILDRLSPFQAISKAANDLEKRLDNQANGATYHAILFEGQGQGQVFESYVEELRSIRDKHKDNGTTVPPQLNSSYENFEDKAKELETLKADFKKQRNANYLGISIDKIDPFSEALQDIFSNTYTTEAFQRGLFITFWAAIEALQDDSVSLTEKEILEALEHYISSLNSFLDVGKDKGKRKKVISTFFGQESIDKETSTIRVVRSSSTLKKIVVPSELKPDEWPRFRYIFLEIWYAHGNESFTNTRIKDYVEHHHMSLRPVVLAALEERRLKTAAELKGLLTSDLSDTEVEEIKKECRVSLNKALKVIGVDLS